MSNRSAGSLIFKQFVPKSEQQAKPLSSTKRIRPRVPDEQRKRARRACDHCRQKKEKCDGNIPCQRCAQENIVCNHGDFIQQDARMSKSEKIERLERIVKHVLGISSIDGNDLRAISDSIDSTGIPSGDVRDVEEGTSLLTFSRQLQQKLGESTDNDEADDEESKAIAQFCQSPSPSDSTPLLDIALAGLPPKDVAQKLVRTCFTYVQCNSFYAQEQWVTEMLDICYTKPSSLSECDIPTIATLSMIIALGTQFTPDLSLEPLGKTLYEQTIKLLPELIQQSTFESARACLLVATYLFPVNLPGLAYTYLGLTLHMATRIGMHKRSTREVEVRVWWTLYTFYQRARIFHGHPRMLSHKDVDVRLPQEDSDFEPKHGVSNFRNQVALIEVTITLEKAADEIASLRKAHKAVHIANLLALRQRLVGLLDTLPSLDYQEQQDTNLARLRLDIHVYLHYWHVRLFVGRPFLLSHSSASRLQEWDASSSIGHSSAQQLLAHDSLDAALNIIQLCQLINDRIGLARSSYATEFTCCRAAMLVLIASKISKESNLLDHALAQGLSLIHEMSVSHGQASSEARVIVALQRAITRLHKRKLQANMSTENEAPYHDYMQQWELLWQRSSVPPHGQPAQVLRDDNTSFDPANLGQGFGQISSPFNVTSPPDLINSDQVSIDSWSNLFSSQLDEFSSIPYMDISYEAANLSNSDITQLSPR